MTPDQFRARFNDMSAGFVGWTCEASGLTVVSCKVYDTFEHEGAWVAAAAEGRAAATKTLKEFGVHGLKFDRRSSKYTPQRLIDSARANAPAVVAHLPDGSLLVFDRGVTHVD